MATYTKVRALSLLRFLHKIFPIKRKLNFLINDYLYHSPSPLSIRYFRQFYICTSVTDLNRNSAGALIFEGVNSQSEVFLIKKLRKKLSDKLFIVDVGGNIGTFAWQLADKCSKIIVFEPVPRLYRVIEDSIEYNRCVKINLIKKALGDHAAKIRMLDNDNSHVIQDNDESNTIEVAVSTLDIELKGEEKIDFIKIDVEGFELKVLKGAVETIKKHRPRFLIELHPAFMRNYTDDYQDLISFLEKHAYRIVYYSFLMERRQPRYKRIINRWIGNPGQSFTTKEEFAKDLDKKPELSSYHLFCEPF